MGGRSRANETQEGVSWVFQKKRLSLSYLSEKDVAKLPPGQETLKLLGTLELLGTAEREK